MIRELIGSKPCVGILAHIDPRTYHVRDIPEGSVRASQLPVVMKRLGKVAALAESITLWDGSRIKIVKASIPVGGPREAAIVQKEFEEAGVIAVIHSMATWSMGWETQFFGHPEWLHLYEAMNGTAWPGAVLLNSLRASATAHLTPVWCSYPPDVEGLSVEDEGLHHVTIRNITQFLKCAAAIAMMRGKGYASMGHVSMGIAGSEGISDIYAHWFGMKFMHVDQLEIYMRITNGMYDKEEAERAKNWFFETFKGKIDLENKRSREEIKKLVDFLILQALVVRDIMRGNDCIKDEERSNGMNALLGGTAGQRYWTDWLPNFDLPEALLTSTFDWNGQRPPITLATEDDGLNGMGMLWAAMLTGFSSLFADLRTYWSPKIVKKLYQADISNVAPTGFLHLINSGPAALDWGTDPATEDPNERMRAAVDAVTWHPADLGYFPNDGLSTHFRTPGGLPVTMIRFNRVGLELTLTVIEGHTIQLPENVANAVRMATNPTWPDTFVVAENVNLKEVLEQNSITALKHALVRHVDTLDVMSEDIDPNHVGCAIGHKGREILLLAAMHRIPVDFHNIPDSWYPTLWQRLGGDRAACKILGPRYA